MYIYLSCTTTKIYKKMNTNLTTAQFQSLTKGVEVFNENGVCNVQVDKNSIELNYYLDLDTNEFVLESFSNYNTDEHFSLTKNQETFLQGLINQKIEQDNAKEPELEKEWWQDCQDIDWEHGMFGSFARPY